MQSGKLDLSTHGSDDEKSDGSDESEYLPTQTLTRKLAEVRLERKKTIQVDEGPNYKWKISAVKHRFWRQAWDVFIIFVALYSVLVIPIRIGINTRLWDPAYDVVDAITWIFYLVDIFVNLRTTYIDNYGFEVIEDKKIMNNYVRSYRFILDVVSLLNLPSFVVADVDSTTQVALSMLGLLKLSRYFRAHTLIVQSRLQKYQKAWASFGYYFVLLLIYLHMLGCLFFFFCLQTYEVSSTRLGILSGMGMYSTNADGTAGNFAFP